MASPTPRPVQAGRRTTRPPRPRPRPPQLTLRLAQWLVLRAPRRPVQLRPVRLREGRRPQPVPSRPRPRPPARPPSLWPASSSVRRTPLPWSSSTALPAAPCPRPTPCSTGQHAATAWWPWTPAGTGCPRAGSPRSWSGPVRCWSRTSLTSWRSWPPGPTPLAPGPGACQLVRACLPLPVPGPGPVQLAGPAPTSSAVWLVPCVAPPVPCTTSLTFCVVSRPDAPGAVRRLPTSCATPLASCATRLASCTRPLVPYAVRTPPSPQAALPGGTEPVLATNKYRFREQ